MRFRVVMLLSLLLVTLFIGSRSFVPAQAQDDHEHEEVEWTEEARALIHDVREATTQYHDLDVALEAGYGQFLDCFRFGDEMGMGQHYVNGDLAGDDVLDPLLPEALVYEPLADGTMTLVAFEYLVFASVWDPEESGREAPTLFGQDFHLKTNIPDTPPVWVLHVWLWTHNPEGIFSDYNPLVFCSDDAPSLDMSQQ
jgi:hypothetical protein